MRKSLIIAVIALTAGTSVYAGNGKKKDKAKVKAKTECCAASSACCQAGSKPPAGCSAK